MQKFKTIALIGKRHTHGISKTLIALIEYLETKKINFLVEKNTAVMLRTHDFKKKIATFSTEDILSEGHKCDLMIVIGGDGSMLSAAKIAANQNIPIVGINRGSLGFLTDIKPNDIKNIGKLLQGHYLEESRFLLNSIIKHGKRTIHQDIALNDIVLLPSEINRMIEFSVYIDHQFVCTHRADGMIVATPTGSTAHALSGGGPILRPGLDAIVLLPMFPHTLSSRPIVVKGDSQIEIIMAKNSRAYPKISCDGRKLVPVPSGGKIIIKKHVNKLRLIHLKDYNYFEILRAKLKWENK
jgi:NAD+ kinase